MPDLEMQDLKPEHVRTRCFSAVFGDEPQGCTGFMPSGYDDGPRHGTVVVEHNGERRRICSARCGACMKQRIVVRHWDAMRRWEAGEPA